MSVESLGRYRIERELGSGAMGRVFLAYDPVIDRRVAIKTVQIFAALPESDRIAARERFLREARAAGKLSHPGIVTIFDVGDMDGVPYLAMEWVEGETLDTFCKPERFLPVGSLVALVSAAAETMAYAHERGIVHRDIKPANLMRVSASAVKIMDFGIARSAAGSMTQDGGLLGTPNYMAPEQVRGEALDGRSDLFSLGVVCFELLTGRKPFGGDSVSSVLYRIVHEPPDLSPDGDRLTPARAAFLARALDKKPSARFPDGHAFAEALRGTGETQARTRRTPGPAEEVPAAAGLPEFLEVKPSARGALTPWLIGSGLLVLLLGLAAWFWSRTTPVAAPLEAGVRTEPAGLPVRLDGRPWSGGRIRFPREGPFAVLTTAQGCREATHRLDPADAGTDIVLELDPERAQVTIDPAVPGGRLSVNGEASGSVPATVDLDLCRENTIAVEAPGFSTAVVTIPAKATPLAARTAASGLRLEPIPTGRVSLPASRGLRFFVDDRPVEVDADGISVPIGSHVVRMVDQARFAEASASVEVAAGQTATPRLELPARTRLTVQSFPPDCEVSLKRDGFAWRKIGETPLTYEVATGRYTVRVTPADGGDPRELPVVLRGGANPPVRVSFGRPAP